MVGQAMCIPSTLTTSLPTVDSSPCAVEAPKSNGKPSSAMRSSTADSEVRRVARARALSAWMLGESGKRRIIARRTDEETCGQMGGSEQGR